MNSVVYTNSLQCLGPRHSKTTGLAQLAAEQRQQYMELPWFGPPAVGLHAAGQRSFSQLCFSGFLRTELALELIRCCCHSDVTQRVDPTAAASAFILSYTCILEGAVGLFH